MMKYIRTSWLHMFLVYIAVILDGSIALNAAQVLFKTPMSASPYLTLIVLMMPIMAGVMDQMTERMLYTTAFLAGLLFDLFYNGIIGIAMIGFPLAVWIATLVQRYFKPNFWSAMATWFIAMSAYLVFDYLGFGVINMAKMSIPRFIMFHMFPSLLVNLMLFIVSYSFLAWLYLKTRRLDTASYDVANRSLDGQLPLRPRTK